MKTPGPATSLRTLSLPLPQKEQRHKRRLLASRESFRLNTWPTRQDTLTTSGRQDHLTPCLGDAYGQHRRRGRCRLHATPAARDRDGFGPERQFDVEGTRCSRGIVGGKRHRSTWRGGFPVPVSVQRGAVRAAVWRIAELARRVSPWLIVAHSRLPEAERD